MIRLYYRSATGRPMRVAWTLEEIGLPYEAIGLTDADCRSSRHLARHPLGRVPVLEDGELTIFESLAIIQHLADRHPEARLTGRPGTPSRAHIDQWAVFAMTELERPVSDFLINRFDNQAFADDGARRFAERAAPFQRILGDREFLVADRLTVADVVTGGVLGIADYGSLLDAGEHAGLLAYLGRLRARPGFQRAVAVTESRVSP